jgi:NhaP-type Na+/H+ or K+/H+ antiporter
VTPTLVFLGVAFTWVLVSARVTRVSVTAPILLTLLGFAAAISPWHLDLQLESEQVRTLIEVTLAVVLFSDASSVGLQWFRRDWRYPARLLGIGLPLTIVAGVVVARLLFPGVDIWLLAVVAAALAPTDAALGASIIADERIPAEFRTVINVESGLNDGLATPVVTFCIAVAAATVSGAADRPVASAVREIVVGVVAGVVIGVLSGRLVRAAAAGGWSLSQLLPVAPLLVAVGTYLAAVGMQANGFVAAFVAGVAFGGATRGTDREESFLFTEQIGSLLGLAVWFVFGAAVLAHLGGLVTWQMVVYAMLSLTVVRMVPVAVSALGLRLPWDTVALAGWLGPRGLASVVFAILALDAIEGADGVFVLTTISVTVALSVLAHGLSAGPLATWFSRRHPAVPDSAPSASSA